MVNFRLVNVPGSWKKYHGGKGWPWGVSAVPHRFLERCHLLMPMLVCTLKAMGVPNWCIHSFWKASMVWGIGKFHLSHTTGDITSSLTLDPRGLVCMEMSRHFLLRSLVQQLGSHYMGVRWICQPWLKLCSLWMEDSHIPKMPLYHNPATSSTNNHFSSRLSQLSLLERGDLQNMKKMSIRKLDELFDTGDGDPSHSETLCYKWELIALSLLFSIPYQPRYNRHSHIKGKIALTSGLFRLLSRVPQIWAALTNIL